MTFSAFQAGDASSCVLTDKKKVGLGANLQQQIQSSTRCGRPDGSPKKRGSKFDVTLYASVREVKFFHANCLTINVTGGEDA